MSKKNSYTRDFKLNAIRMYLCGEYGGYTPVSKMLNLTRTNLINWVKKYSEMGDVGLEDGRGKKTEGIFVFPPKIEGLPIVEENLRLKAENAYLREILKLNIKVIKKKHTTK